MTDADTLRQSAIRFMNELQEHNWPSDEAWNALRAACGLDPLPPIRPGGCIDGLRLIAPGPSTEFKP